MKKLSPVFIILSFMFLFTSCGKKNEMKQDSQKPDPKNADSIKTNAETKGDTSKIFSRELEGWYIGNGEDYSIGKDSVKYGDENIFYLVSKDTVKNEWGMISKDTPAEKFTGSKLKLTGYIKTENIEKWAGMWMRINSKENNKVVGFDNMQDRPIKGTTPWKKYEIVLGVPDNSRLISYGALITGKGKVYISNFTLEVTGKDLPAKQ